MHNAIEACLQKLLFEHQSVSMPGLGSFVVVRKSAQADIGLSSVTPPSRTLQFDENLQADDGLLADELARSLNLSHAEAQQRQREFAAQIQERLNKREIVSIQGIGRLYKNYMGQVQFLPDASNFSAEHFGLPALQFSPLSRMQAEQIPTPLDASAPPPQPPDPPAEQEASASRFAAVLRGALAALLVLLALAAAYWFWQKKTAASPEAPEPAPVETPVAAAPTASAKTDIPAPTPAPTPTPTPKAAPKAEAPKAAAPAPAQKPRPNQTQGARKCVIVIATLQDASNAERLKNLLVEQGYELYYLRQKGHQVGIQFTYNDAFDIQSKLRELEQLTGERNMWIKQK
ncbi:MAG: hypothetical protein ACK4NS_08145 [Saprospiraceae bacterium]